MSREFRTERLLLRRLSDGDAEWLAKLDCDADVMRYIREPSEPAQALDDARRRIEWDQRHPEFGLWAAVDLDVGEIHGWIGLKPLTMAETVDRNEIELGFRLRRSSWGRGFAAEGGAALLDYGLRDLALRRVIGVAMAGNIGSKRVLERLGFRFTASVQIEQQTWDNYEVLGSRAEACHSL